MAADRLLSVGDLQTHDCEGFGSDLALVSAIETDTFRGELLHVYGECRSRDKGLRDK